MDAFSAYAEEYTDEAKIWKVYTYCWACESANAIEGDFVECGVFRGLYSATMARYFDFGTFDRRLYLYDTYEGIPVAGSTENERRFNTVYDEE
jgi:O-methyltransferase